MSKSKSNSPGATNIPTIDSLKITITPDYLDKMIVTNKENFYLQDGALSLPSLLESVKKHYPLILAQEQLLNAAEFDYLAAQGAFDTAFKMNNQANPTGFYRNTFTDSMIEKPTPLGGTSFFAGYRMGRGNFVSYDGKRATNDLGEFRAGAILPLVRNRETDKNRTDLKKADIDRNTAELNIKRLQIEVTRIATQRYWKWVAAGQEYTVAKNLYDIAQQRVEQIKERVRLGDLAKIENTENDRVILQREALLISAERELQKASIDLSLLYRDDEGQMILPQSSQLPLAFPSPLDKKFLSLEDEIQKAFDIRPELQEFKNRKEKLKLDKELAENNLKPQVDLVVAASQDLGAGSVTRSRPELEANLVLNIPLETRRQRGAIGGIESRIQQVIQEEQFARDRIKAEIQDAISDVEATRKRFTAAQNELILAKRLEVMEKERFNLGDTTLLFVNIREQTTGEAAVREIKALFDHYNAMANYAASIAETLREKK